MKADSPDTSSTKSAGTLLIEDDGERLHAVSKPQFPLILAAVLACVAAGLVLWASNEARRPPSVLEEQFPALGNGDSEIALLVGVFLPLTVGWMAFELWRSRRFDVVFGRADRQVTMRRYWPIGPTEQVSLSFDDVTEVSLGGQVANRGGLYSTATVELTTSDSHYRITGWVAFEDANRLQVQILAALADG